MITQNIPVLPTPPSSNDATNFRSRADEFLSALPNFGNTLNTFKTEANNTLDEMNLKASQTAQKATEAQDAAAKATAKAELAQAVVIPTNATYSLTQLDTRNTIMSKAAFNALAAERRANRAGSGFDEWGKHLTTNPNINEGIWCFTTLSNKFGLGYSGAGGSTISKTNFPLSSINGVIHNLTGIFDGYTDRNIITLPQSPTIYPYGTTLTTEQLALGCITHANASNNSGLIINGKFGTDNDTSGWTTFNGATIGVSSGRISITTSYLNSGAKQTFATTVGKEYIVECEINAGTLSVPARVDIAGISSLNTTTNTYPTRISFKFTATSTSHAVQFYCYGTPSASQTFYVDSIAVFPADAISRSDLVFLESWHEDVSEKDFVYPLGNVQYLGGVTDGMSAIVAGAFSGSGTYSLFGNWQASGALVGKGYVWSGMSDAQKKAFVSNPENNCYLYGDNVIQVRYRMRVVAGWGDSWVSVTDIAYETSGLAQAALRYSGISNYVVARGKRTTLSGGELSAISDFLTFGQVTGNREIGTWSTMPTNTPVAYEGKCYALPIALVHRRNQGGYDATYNLNGARTMTMTPTCIADCFNTANYNASTGYIGTSTSRSDGLFYDQVSAIDFKPTNKGADLRTTTKKRTAQSLIEEFAPKVIAGTLLYNNNDTTALTTYKDFMEVRDTSGNRYPIKNKIGNVVTINDTVANKKGFSIVTQNGKQYLQVADDAASDAAVQMNLSVTKYDLGVFDA